MDLEFDTEYLLYSGYSMPTRVHSFENGVIYLRVPKGLFTEKDLFTRESLLYRLENSSITCMNVIIRCVIDFKDHCLLGIETKGLFRRLKRRLVNCIDYNAIINDECSCNLVNKVNNVVTVYTNSIINEDTFKLTYKYGVRRLEEYFEINEMYFDREIGFIVVIATSI